jgi:hypothetical protein
MKPIERTTNKLYYYITKVILLTFGIESPFNVLQHHFKFVFHQICQLKEAESWLIHTILAIEIEKLKHPKLKNLIKSG